MITFIKRMIRAIMLDAELYEEIPVDHGYLYQSIAIIILSSLSAGIATLPDNGALGFVLMTVIAIFCWILWGYITFFAANMLMDAKEQSIDFIEVVRITGFASAPGILRALGVVPGLLGIVFLISGIWMMIMIATSIKHAFDFDMLRALGVSIIGGAVQPVILSLFI